MSFTLFFTDCANNNISSLFDKKFYPPAKNNNLRGV
jgi:hypothetical protein